MFLVTQGPRHPLYMAISYVTSSAITLFMPTKGVLRQLEMTGGAPLLTGGLRHPAGDGPAMVPVTSLQLLV